MVNDKISTRKTRLKVFYGNDMEYVLFNRDMNNAQLREYVREHYGDNVAYYATPYYQHKSNVKH